MTVTMKTRQVTMVTAGMARCWIAIAAIIRPRLVHHRRFGWVHLCISSVSSLVIVVWV